MTDKVYSPLVYICSPLSGDIPGNTEKARKYCRFALDKKDTEVDCPARTVSKADLHTAVMNTINSPQADRESHGLR